MKIGKAYVAAVVVVALAVGTASGVLLQGYYGVGNQLESIGVSFRASSPPQTTPPRDSRIPKKYQGKLQLFILAGQSNMSGAGDIPPSGAITNPRIYVFGNDYRWRRAVEPVDDPSNQVDKVSEDPAAGFSPALSFATAILKQHPDMVIGLIPCAKGGSSINEWARSLSDHSLYGASLKHVRAASTMGDVAGVLFFQGEADALDPRQHPEKTLLPDRWGKHFAGLVGNWRRDLNSPELPVVFAQIGTNAAPENCPYWATVKEQQARVRLPSVTMITTDDLSLKDTFHFTAESYQVIGQRFAQAYLELRQEQRK